MKIFSFIFFGVIISTSCFATENQSSVFGYGYSHDQAYSIASTECAGKEITGEESSNDGKHFLVKLNCPSTGTTQAASQNVDRDSVKKFKKMFKAFSTERLSVELPPREVQQQQQEHNGFVTALNKYFK